MKSFICKTLLVGLVCLFAVGPCLAAPYPMAHERTLSAPMSARSAVGNLIGLLATGVAVFGAIRVKDVGSIAKKFVRNATSAQGDYAEGVKAGAQDWETNTKAAEENYKQGVQQAAARGAFGKGVARAGQGKYLQRATTLGPQRYGQGVAAAEGEFAKGIAPVLQTLSGIQLPPRYPKGDPRNQERANVVARELNRVRVGS